MITIREEQERDWAAIQAVNEAAFERPQEGELVAALRRSGEIVLSLVAETADNLTIVGHILFSPVTIGEQCVGVALGPLAVLPAWQKRGVGSQLCRAGLAVCAEQGHDRLIVLGHPTYYSRFGFIPASQFGLHSEYDVPDEVFMAQALAEGAFSGCSGLVKYAPAFSAV